MKKYVLVLDEKEKYTLHHILLYSKWSGNWNEDEEIVSAKQLFEKVRELKVVTKCTVEEEDD